MNILYVTSEAVPFIKSGGLADVAGTLPLAMRKNADKVSVIMPCYSLIDKYFRDSMQHICDFYVSLGWRNQYCGIEKLERDGVTFYFIDNKYYFGRNYLYGDMCMDECERFCFFNKSVLEALQHIDFYPNIIHCNDWQCGMVPYLLRQQYSHLASAHGMKTVYTIHNIHYQGIFPGEWINDFLSVPFCDIPSMEFYGNTSFMKAGIVYSDAVTTVSPTYAKEITSSDIGEGLQGVLNAKLPPVSGILNGLDLSMFSPYDDIHLEHHYAAYELSGKYRCKDSLQYELWLDKAPDIPLLSVVSRLTEQKGLSLIEHTYERLLSMNVQLAVIGTGDKHFEDFFKWLSSKYGGKVCARIEYNEHMSRRIYAGSDIFIMPSRTEPCGLAQLIAMRYGTIPVVHETGGLSDTIIPYNKYTGEGTGFTFYDYNEHQFISAIERALSCYYDKKLWETLVNRVMQQSFTWDTSARKYFELYKSLIK